LDCAANAATSIVASGSTIDEIASRTFWNGALGRCFDCQSSIALYALSETGAGPM
jgi:hypothetical protein